MSVKLVMGAQRDSLEKLEKFGGEDGGVIFPHFRQDLENALRFELGEVGVMILRNQFPMNTIKRGERVDKVPGLITMLLAKNRSDIQFKSSWIETTKEVDIADPEKEYDVITAEGEVSMRSMRAANSNSVMEDPRAGGLHSCGTNTAAHRRLFGTRVKRRNAPGADSMPPGVPRAILFAGLLRRFPVLPGFAFLRVAALGSGCRFPAPGTVVVGRRIV